MKIDISCGKLPHGRTIKEKLLDYIRPSRFGDFSKTTLSKNEIVQFETIQESSPLVDEIQEACTAMWLSTEIYLETTCKLHANFTSGSSRSHGNKVNEHGQTSEVDPACMNDKRIPDAAPCNPAPATPENHISLIEILGQVRALLKEEVTTGILTPLSIWRATFDNLEVKDFLLHQYKEELDLCRYRMSLCNLDASREGPTRLRKTSRKKVAHLQELKLKASTVAFQFIHDAVAVDLKNMAEELKRFPTLLQQMATLSEAALGEARSKLSNSLVYSSNSSICITGSPSEIVSGGKVAEGQTSGYAKTKSGLTIHPIKINWRGTMKSPAQGIHSTTSDITMNDITSV